MNESDHLDATALKGVEVLIFAAKATRFLSRGSTVAIETASNGDVAELHAWARWAGHGYRSGEREHEVVVVVRERR